MKKTISIIFMFVLLAGSCVLLSACGKQDKTPPVSGGWAKLSSPVITQELREIVAKAAAKESGADYTPVAHLEEQVVAGMNHLVLCKKSTEAGESWVLVTIYADLNDDAKITSELSCEAEVPFFGEGDGTWSESKDAAVSEALESAIKKANSVLAGGQYEPVALLGTQLVAGTNYCALCELTATVPDAQPQYVIATIYEDLNGNAEILNSADFR